MRYAMRGPRGRRGWSRLVAVAVLCTLIVACGDDEEADPVAAAEERVSEAEASVAEAQTAFDEAGVRFCEDAADYITAVDRYGGVFDDTAATVGDVRTAGADLEEPRESVTSAAEDVVAARDDVAQAERELVEAQAALAQAQTGVSAATTVPTTTTTTPLLPEPTIDRVRQAEEELADVSEGITDETPLAEASEQFNAAAFAVQVSWLRLYADAGCLTDEEQAQAAAAVAEYTVALQTSLQTAGYYDDEVDGVYGSMTVEAVEQLQADSDLPVTGLVDQATAAALEAAVLAAGGDVAAQAIAHTAAVQSALTLLGYWTGPVDGQWTPELTEALMELQTDLGVEPTGSVDAATLAALEQALAEIETPTTSIPPTTDATTTEPPSESSTTSTTTS